MTRPPPLGRARYPERSPEAPGLAALALDGIEFLAERAASGRRERRMLARVGALGAACAALSEEAIPEAARRVRRGLQREGLDSEHLPEALALGRELMRRRLGTEPGEAELAAAWLAVRGRVAALAPGGERSLAVALAAFAAGLGGWPVHVIAANDELAARNLARVQEAFRAAGLESGVVAAGTPGPERAAAYAGDIVYATARELGFDYLKDRVLLGGRADSMALAVERACRPAPRAARLLLPGLCLAIADDADHVLLDQGRHALAVSGEVGDSPIRLLKRVLEAARRLAPGRDYEFGEDGSALRLGRRGLSEAERLDREIGDAAGGRQRVNAWFREALAACAMARGRDYEVVEGKVTPLAEAGEIAETRRIWVELKEGMRPSSLHQPLGRLALRTFYARYLRLGGVTAVAPAREMLAVYRLRTLRVRAGGRGAPRRARFRFCFTVPEKWTAIAGLVRQLTGAGVPVVIGVGGPEDAESAQAALAGAGIEAAVASGQDPAADAAALARCLATRGVGLVTTDALAGLEPRALAPASPAPVAVILGQALESARHEQRMLSLPGAGEFQAHAFAALDEEFFETYASPPLLALAESALRGNWPAAGWLLRWMMRHAQRRADRSRRLALTELVRHEEQVRQLLTFAGRGA